MKNIAIIGGGISGLYIANLLRQNSNYETIISEDKDLLKIYKEFLSIENHEKENTNYPWIIRFIFDKEKMLEYGIIMEDIYMKLSKYTITFGNKSTLCLQSYSQYGESWWYWNAEPWGRFKFNLEVHKETPPFTCPNICSIGSVNLLLSTKCSNVLSK